MYSVYIIRIEKNQINTDPEMFPNYKLFVYDEEWQEFFIKEIAI